MRRTGLALAVLAAACATSTAGRERPPPAPVPGKPLFLVVPVSPDAVVAREEHRLERHGFTHPAPRRPGMAPAAPGARGIALASKDLRPHARPACSGAAEVVQLEATPRGDGSALRVECYTTRLHPPASRGGSCLEAVTLGCPNGGDRAVGEVASDALDLQ